ncbi:uncharacterized protein FA14DRAFT_85322 [Meira miltonrushii]|uniref:Uncharacterized protein n=1 Tax=Meira miltonrushii TaxID=1280837 RepID=A0A316V3K9_9BASI|nr:uncharacterized protein FA14DRAFT_85322 [Meira miltonrushii]PWN32147.1 hypothetical protein FA14DRAFT_85322 [Meira miltonrushii]
MSQKGFVQVFQDDDLRDVNRSDQDHNSVLNALDEPNNSLGERRYIHNDTSFATTSSFNNTKFDPMSSSDNLDHSDFNHNHHSAAADFGFLPESPQTTDTCHSNNNFSRPHLQRGYTGNSVDMYASVSQSNTSESAHTLRNVSTIHIIHCGFSFGVFESAVANKGKKRERITCLNLDSYLIISLRLQPISTPES